MVFSNPNWKLHIFTELSTGQVPMQRFQKSLLIQVVASTRHLQ